MAYDISQNEEWAASYRKQKELEASRQMTAEQRAQAMKKAMGYGNR